MDAEDTKTVVFDVVRGSFVDGPGIRTTVFFKGCNLRCAWCHNPESQCFERQMMFFKSKCTGCGTCGRVCPHGLERCGLCGACELLCPGGARKICGREMTPGDVFAELEKDKDFYENAGGGATFSGGECMLHIDFLETLLKKCRENGIHTAVDTAGHVGWQHFERILPYADLFLYDVKMMPGDAHKKFTGVRNDLILENLARLSAAGARIWIRVPVIGGVNDNPGETKRLQKYLERLHPEKVEFLPYHRIGENKYRALGAEPPMFPVPSD